jgi:hypothetical protein
MPLQATVKAKNSASFPAVRPLLSARIYPQILLQTLLSLIPLIVPVQQTEFASLALRAKRRAGLRLPCVDQETV